MGKLQIQKETKGKDEGPKTRIPLFTINELL